MYYFQSGHYSTRYIRLFIRRSIVIQQDIFVYYNTLEIFSYILIIYKYC